MIGILTFHRASNYGAVLQAYALQATLARLGYESEIVDYRCAVLEEHHAPKTVARLMAPRNVARALLRNAHMRDRRALFEAFVSRRLHKSPRVYNSAQELATERRYSAYIAGSDQVWNHRLTGFDRVYFLEFAGLAPKLAYAASLGLSALPEQLTHEYARLLGDFASITVREEAAARLLGGLLHREIPVVLDPTLLLTPAEWWRILPVPEAATPMKRYVLVYLLAETTGMLRYARGLARMRRCGIVNVSQRLLRPLGMTTLSEASPEEFIRLVAGADAVVTNSFHGMALAANFGVDLHWDLLPDSSLVNSRLENLSDILDLSSTRISRERRAALPRNANISRMKLDFERERSIDILRKMIREVGG